MRSQRACLETADIDWLLITDAGRSDVFESLYPEYLTGTYERVHNGGVQNTPAWFARHFPDSYDAMLFHGGQPIRSIAAEPGYDERDHFAHVPYTTLYESNHLDVAGPWAVNDVVRQHLPDRLEVDERLHALGYRPSELSSAFEFRIIRYLQPHKPYRKLPQTAGDRGIGNASPDEVRDAYIDNYRWVLDAITDLLEDLPGTVVVTADHGECTGDCGQYMHGPQNDPHDHLHVVPWIEVDGTVERAH